MKNVTVRRIPYSERKKTSGHKAQMWLDTKTYWLTDRQSQCDFDFDFDFDLIVGVLRRQLEE
jgi:hypothetical protein